MPYYRLIRESKSLKRKCVCGGQPQMYRDFVGDYVVRCEACHESTNAFMTMKEAVKAWEKGKCTGPLDLLTDNLEKHLVTVKALYVCKDDFERINMQSCDASELIADTGEKLICVGHGKYDTLGCLEFGDISGFNEEFYRYKIDLSEKECVLERVEYHKNGLVDALKYKCKDGYLFIFSDEYNLIITMSKSDLLDDDKLYDTEATLEIEDIG